MFTLRAGTVPAAVLTLVLGLGVAGCSSDDDPGNGGTGPGVSPVVGTWNATSLTVAGVDLIAQGMGFGIDFESNGLFLFTVSNDMGDFCDSGAANCTETGDYTSSATQIVLLDPDDVDDIAFNYVIVGTTMTMTGTGDAAGVVIVLNRV